MQRGRTSELPMQDSRNELQDFDALVQQHRPRIFRFLLASLRDRESAENLTQDCFVRAYQARDNFRGASSVATWLVQIAVNLVRDHESSGRLKFWRRMLRTGADVTDLADAVSDRELSPEMRASMHEQVQAVWSAARELPGKQRTVFLLRFVEEMEVREIAEATGMKEGTVKVHLFRALAKVRARLEGKQ